MIARPQFIVFY